MTVVQEGLALECAIGPSLIQTGDAVDIEFALSGGKRWTNSSMRGSDLLDQGISRCACGYPRMRLPYRSSSV